ncbi:hypothetical protein MCOR14_008128, partial [Pyricularia oryzae]
MGGLSRPRYRGGQHSRSRTGLLRDIPPSATHRFETNGLIIINVLKDPISWICYIKGAPLCVKPSNVGARTSYDAKNGEKGSPLCPSPVGVGSRTWQRVRGDLMISAAAAHATYDIVAFCDGGGESRYILVETNGAAIRRCPPSMSRASAVSRLSGVLILGTQGTGTTTVEQVSSGHSKLAANPNQSTWNRTQLKHAGRMQRWYKTGPPSSSQASITEWMHALLQYGPVHKLIDTPPFCAQ